MDGTRRKYSQVPAFDNRTSRMLENIDIKLMDNLSPLHRRLLNIQRRWYERNVPAYHGEVAQ